LTQPQDKKSLNPGDADEAVLARHRWLQRGHAAELIKVLQDLIRDDSNLDANPRVLDLGCGEGSFAPALFPNNAVGYCGIDLSRRAIKLAARNWPAATICVVAIPGEEDLIELREQVQQSGHRRSRWELVVQEMEAAGLTLSLHQKWNQKVDLDADEIADALAMTYRAVRNSQNARLAGVDRMNVTLAADLLVFQQGQ